jgi:pyruvate formate lyase activating enzyme
MVIYLAIYNNGYLMQETFNFAHFIPVSTVDWHRRSAAVLFFRGCQFRCPYCHNFNYLRGSETMRIKDIQARINKASRFISALVCSGGEPTMQPEALKAIVRSSVSRSLAIGLETNGFGVDVVRDMLDEGILDKVFLDIKAPLDEPVRYARVTGLDLNMGAKVAKHASETLHRCLEADIELEVRTTVFRGLTDINDVVKIGHYLDKYASVTYAIQQGIPENTMKLKDIQVFNRDEILEMVKAINAKNLKEIWIRTAYNGNEKVR